MQIAMESRDFVARTREGKLRPEDYSDGTFTVSNMGMLWRSSPRSSIPSSSHHGCRDVAPGRGTGRDPNYGPYDESYPLG